MAAPGHSPIVVTVDQPPIGHDAALWSACLADRLHCPLRVVYIVPEAGGTGTDGNRPRRAPIVAPARGAWAIIDAATVAVRDRFPGLEVSGGVIEGPAGQALDSVADGARMVVLGHPDAGAVDVFGATFHTDTVTEHTLCPVVTWRGPAGRLPDERPVILAVDAADSAGAALVAFEYAHLFGAPLVAMRSPSLHQAEQDAPDSPLLTAQRAFPDVAVTTVVIGSPLQQALADRTADAQLVVIGTPGRHQATSPSPSSHLFRHGRCPTMICPPPPDGTARPSRALPHLPAVPVLADGAFTIRALTADDRVAVEHLHENLSTADAYLRFFGPRPKHLEQFAEGVCRQDFTHLALGAFERDELVGVANYVVTDTAQGHLTAEIALTVSGHEQQHGIGTLLVQRLGTAAYFHGVTRLTAEILAENTLMLAVISEQGWDHALRHEGATVHLDLELVANRESHPDIPVLPQEGKKGRAIGKR